jgi:hypothetical protein
MESYAHQLSNSPREEFPNPKLSNFQRRFTMPTKAFEKLTEHLITNRKEFEEAVSHVFEKDIANKSLSKKNRINEDILLDNHAFGRNRNISPPKMTFDSKLSSDSSSESFERCSSLRELKNHKTV